MDAHRKFQQNLAQGVRAGHINISDQTHGRAVYGSAAEEAMREKEQIERSLEQQKLKGQIHIPTNDTEVKNRLRILHEPICYFGEDAAARRSRLHEIIASKMSKGEKLPEFRRENEEINIQINQLLSKMQQSHKNKQTKKTIPATSTTASTSTSNKSKMKTNKTKEVLSPSKIAKFDNTGSLVTIAQKQVDLTLSNEKKEDTAGGTNATTATATTTTTTTTTTASAAAGIGSTTKTVTKKKHSKPKKKKKGKTKVTSSMVHTGHTFRSQVGTPPGMISSARRDILHFSMKNAGERVGKQRKRRENPLPPAIIREQRANTIKKLQNYSCQSSVIGGERPLTVIRVSPPILPPSSSSSSSSKQKNQENSDYPCTNGDEKKTDNNNNESNIIKVEPIHATDDMVDISYDRYLIGIGSKGGEITLWNEDGVEQARWQGHSDHITGFAWDPYNFMLDTSKNVTNCGVLKENLRFLTSSIDQTIGLWDVNGKLYHRFDTRSNFNNTVYSDKDINRMDHKERLNRIAWHPMGRHFISTSHDRSWMFWDIVQQVPLYIQKGHSAGVYSVDCQCDGSLLATGDMGGIIRLWDLRSGRCIMSFDQHIEGVLDLSFSFNGYLLASASQDHSCQIWDLRKIDHFTIPAHNHSLTCVQFCFPNICHNNGSKSFFSSNNNNNKSDNKFSIFDHRWFDGSYTSEWLITAGMDRCVKVWSANNQSTFPLCNSFSGHEAQIAYADISFDGNFIVSCSYDKTWKLWATDEYIFENDTQSMKNGKFIKHKREPLVFKRETTYNIANNDNNLMSNTTSNATSTLVTNVQTSEPVVPFNVSDVNGKMEIDD